MYTHTSTGSVPARRYYVPYVSSTLFTGRDCVMEKIRQTCLPSRSDRGLAQQKRFVLYGLGGSGKSQVCLKFAEDHKNKFWGVFWVDASCRKTIEECFKEIGRKCGIEEDSGVVKCWLSIVQYPWLLIIDNADDPSMDISKHFPSGNRGTILLTTRNPDLEIHATVGSYELGQMKPDEAMTLLSRASGIADTTEAKRIVETLGYLALAIAQAGAYIRNGHCSIEEYCDEYFRHPRKLLSYRKVEPKSNYTDSVSTTWERSVEAIKYIPSRTSGNALQLIHVLCFFHPNGITQDVLERWWSKAFCSTGISKIREATSLLARFSLIKIQRTNDSRLSMHPLVQMWARNRLSASLHQRYWGIALSVLAYNISWKFEASDFRVRSLLVPHIDSCIRICREKGSPLFTKGSVTNRIAMTAAFALAYAENGRNEEAMELREQVVEAYRDRFGDEHETTLKAMISLSWSYNALKRKDDAMRLQEKVLEASRRTLGNQHPDTRAVIHRLAATYSGAGRFQQAISLFNELLDTCRTTQGFEDLETLSVMGNFAHTYVVLKRWPEAIELQEEVVRARRKKCGRSSPHTLMAMINLASSYKAIGHLKEAAKLEREYAPQIYAHMKTA